VRAPGIVSPVLGGLLACVFGFAAPAAAAADGLAQLKTFHETTKSGKVTFQQVVAAKGQATTKDSTGTFSFQRPGKFRWAYEKPFEQVIVGEKD